MDTFTKAAISGDLTVRNSKGETKESKEEVKSDTKDGYVKPILVLPSVNTEFYVNDKKFKVIYINESQKWVTCVPMGHRDILTSDTEFYIGFNKFQVSMSSTEKNKFSAKVKIVEEK